MAPSSAGCSAAGPAGPASPNARGRRSSTAACRPSKPWPCYATWPTAAASARPVASWGFIRTRWSATASGPAATPPNSTTSSWLFPPQTTKVQLDEKWSFVGKKEKHCNPTEEADWFQGDQWDHVALDPDHRLVLEVVVGKRLGDNAVFLLEGVRDRLG